MKIFVKAAHTFIHGYHCIDTIRTNIIRHSTNLSVNPTFAIRALLPLMEPDIIRRPIDLTGHPLLPSPSLESLMEQRRALDRFDDRDWTILSYCLHSGAEWKTIRRSVPLTVDPTVTIGAIKLMLKPHPWIPKENLVLVQHEERALENDDSTLDECGVKDCDTLLACMGGSFTLIVSCEKPRLELVVPINSCLETIGDVKRKIGLMMGYPEMGDDRLVGCDETLCKDRRRLVALGIGIDIRFSDSIPAGVHWLSLVRRLFPQMQQEHLKGSNYVAHNYEGATQQFFASLQYHNASLQ